MSTAEKVEDQDDRDDDETSSESDANEKDGDGNDEGSPDSGAATKDSKDDEKKKARSAEPVSTVKPQGIANLRTVWTIARRETRAYFDSLVAYVVIGGSTLGLGIYFFLLQSGGFWQVDRATMARMFEFMPWALGALVIPLVTMRALAEEKRSGTLELLITLPVRDSEVILGKYFAAVMMCLTLLVVTLVYPIAMFVYPWHLGALDWGPVLTGYLGLALFSMAGVAVGMMFSSLTESQIIAFFLTAGAMMLFYILGWVVEAMPGWTGEAIAFVSFQTRYLPFSRGLIDTRAIVYFLSIAVLCLLVSFRALESRKWS